MFWNKKPKYELTYITDDNFEALVAKSDLPVLIDFYADWCGPCKILGPIIEELAEEYEGRALVAKVNTEVNPKLSQLFKINPHCANYLNELSLKVKVGTKLLLF